MKELLKTVLFLMEMHAIVLRDITTDLKHFNSSKDNYVICGGKLSD